MAATVPVPLVSLFTEVEDPRRPQARRHALEDIHRIATLTVICGADLGPAVELFGRQKQAWLATFLALPHGIPSHDTFGRVLARLAPQEGCFTRWVRSLAVALQDQVVSVDSKLARRSRDAVRGVPTLHPVSAWADQERLVLGQVSAGWTTSPTRSRPFRSCSRCWCLRASS